jgi:hypothetical protein
VKPSDYRTTGFNIARSWTNSDTYNQYSGALFIDCELRPNTTYCIGFKCPTRRCYFNENLFDSLQWIQTNGQYQYFVMRTKDSISTQHYANGYLVLKNDSGNSAPPNFTDVCVSLADSRFDGQYEKYKGEWTYPLADTELRGIPKLDSNNNLYFDGDTYYPNGDVIRKYGVIDLGSLTWGQQDVGNTQMVSTFFCNDIQTLVKAPSANADKANIICSKYTTVSYADYFSVPPLEGVSIHMSGQLRVSDPNNTFNKNPNTFKTAMNGIYLIYELATPTEEKVAGYSNPHTLIRKGAEEFVDDRTIALPVGHETEYAQLPGWLSNNNIFL